MALGIVAYLDLSYPYSGYCYLRGTPWEVSNVTDIYVGIRKETEDGIPESDLRQHICPQCGNVDILTGDDELDKDVKPILAGGFLDENVSFLSMRWRVGWVCV